MPVGIFRSEEGWAKRIGCLVDGGLKLGLRYDAMGCRAEHDAGRDQTRYSDNGFLESSELIQSQQPVPQLTNG